MAPHNLNTEITLTSIIPSYTDVSSISMDMQLFQSSVFQRAYQYLKKQEDGANLDTFHFKEGSVVGDDRDFISLVVR